MNLPVWFDHLDERFSQKEVQFTMFFFQSVKISRCPATEKLVKPLYRILAGWASRHPVDSHLLKKTVLFSYIAL